MSREAPLGGVAKRLDELRRLYRPMDADEARRAMEPPAASPDLSPSLVAARLDELRALCELTAHLQRASTPGP